MLLSGKIQFLFVLALNIVISFSSAESENGKGGVSRRELNTFVMKFNEKLDYISDRVDRMEQQSKGNDAIDAMHEILANISRAISSSKHEIKQKVEENLKIKIETFEEKQNRMEELLFRFLNGSEKERGDGGVWRGVTSLCHSICQAKLSAPSNQTGSQPLSKVEQIKLCQLSEQKAVNNTCDSNPCLNGGQCQPTTTGNDYVCACPTFRSGIHCEHVECSIKNRCWRYKNTLYVVIETRLLWADAKLKCESKGMTMAILKDAERTRFLYDLLKPMYGGQYGLYVGLKREKGGWYWVDGSAFDEDAGGWDNRKSQTFAGLFNKSTRDYNYGYGNGKSYPLCQTH